MKMVTQDRKKNLKNSNEIREVKTNSIEITLKDMIRSKNKLVKKLHQITELFNNGQIDEITYNNQKSKIEPQLIEIMGKITQLKAIRKYGL